MVDMDKNDKIVRALCDWLTSQELSPSEGVMAMSTVIGLSLGEKAKHLLDLSDGLHRTYMLIEANGYAALEDRNLLVIRKAKP